MANECLSGNIVVVGSAPLQIDYGNLVDSSEIVVRFNDCKNFGGASGQRTDIIYVNNTGSPAMRYINERPFALKAYCQSAVIWFVRDSSTHHAHFNKVKSSFPRYPVTDLDDLSERIIQSNQLKGRETHSISRAFNDDIFNKLSMLSKRPFICPSTGFLGLMHVLTNPAYKNCQVHAIGFGFDGWKGHPWDAEKKIISNYALSNRLVMHPNDLPGHSLYLRFKIFFRRSLSIF